MKTTVELNESELAAMIRDYIQDQGHSLEGKSAVVTFKCKGQSVSVSAEVEITEARGSYFDR